ncbi:glucose-methanol-choline oxidoreductase [Jackrogersella minutella]|nr:glucose-methanol-choline oxidoreductase [Jackrogersella minutella]
MSLINTSSSFPGDPTNIEPGQYLSVSAFSRGSIHITGPGPSDVLDFKTGFFSDAHGVDIKKCAWAYKKQREIVRRMDVYRGRPKPPLEYTEADAVLENLLRQNVASAWHLLGTRKMASREEDGVVDANLGVHSVIPPLDAAANTNNTAIAVGEKAADIFIRKLGLGY